MEVGERLGEVGSPTRCEWSGGRRSATQERRANPALGPVEAGPGAVPRSGAATARSNADGVGESPEDGVSEEGPQGARGEARAPNFGSDPDAGGASAAGSPVAVAAKDAAGPKRLALGAAVIEPAERAVAIEGANGLAVRTRCEFESLDEGDPVGFVPVEPAVIAHARGVSAVSRRVYAGGRGAGSSGVRETVAHRKTEDGHRDQAAESERSRTEMPLSLQSIPSDGNSAKPSVKCDHSVGKHK